MKETTETKTTNKERKDEYEQLSTYLTEAFLFMNHYEWISNSYVAEFFTQNLWMKLPTSWRNCLEQITLAEVALNILKYEENKIKTYSRVWPLSLLSFVATCHALALERRQKKQYDTSVPPLLTNVFKKHIKPKKRHELSLLPQVIRDICEKTGARCIVDVGSGLGHLARFLAYKYGYQVTAIEMTSERLPVAEKFDKEMEMELQRIGEKIEGYNQFGTVRHVARRIDENISSEEFCKLIDQSRDDSKCVLIGLHTCGDLASTMLKVFKNTDVICGIVSVSCCYFKMTLKDDLAVGDSSCGGKLTCGGQRGKRKDLFDDFSLSSFYELIHNGDNDSSDYYRKNSLQKELVDRRESELQPDPDDFQSTANQTVIHGFPLSNFLQRTPCQPLKYKSFETACHFIDDYSQKLLDNSPNLKLHCYRAIMEVLLRLIDPALVLTAVRCKKIKNAAHMTFEEYAENVIRRVRGEFDPSLLSLVDCDELLSQWRSVAVYHSLALLLGPLIESIALTDKLMFLLESQFDVELVPLFDPKISPRNFVVIATKD